MIIQSTSGGFTNVSHSQTTSPYTLASKSTHEDSAKAASEPAFYAAPSSPSPDDQSSISTSSDNQQRKMAHHSAAGTAAASMMSAGISQFIHHPVYTFKTHRQRKSNLSIKEFLINAKDHPSFLFKGVMPRSLGCMPEKMLKMQAYMTVLRFMEDRVKPNSEKAKLATWGVAGCAAGMATTIIGCPAELLMVQAQTGNVSVREFFRQKGLRGVYQGASVTIWRDVAFNMAFFTSRQGLISLYCRQFNREPIDSAKFALGVMSGVFAASVSCPLDVIKTRMQEQQASRRPWPVLLTRIVQREGVLALYHGIGPRCCAVPSMMSLFALLQERFEMFFFGDTVLRH